MSDFNQTSNQNLPGFEEYPTLPDFSTFLTQKMAAKANTNPNVTSFDPHKIMVDKLKLDKGEEVDTTPKIKWPEKEVQALEDFCAKNGIVGFNCGRMSPSAALAFLKTKLGVVDAPLEERVPYGYQKIGGEKKVLHG